ncbi:MAG TPA: S9 family peptidase, partial [Chryseosolibacter sp.]|nr:S9 family peptidase [Chryseosolibacter sp.]
KIVRYDVTTGLPVETVFDGATFSPKLVVESYDFSTDEGKILIRTEFQSIYRRSYSAEYFVFDRSQKTIQKLSTNGRQSYATFSPDGSKVAFVRMNNLFVVDLTTLEELQITADGAFNKVINGSTDWVYEEEFSFVIGFFWSPDSRKIAYYKFDESGVREYNLQRWNAGVLYPEDYRFKYPKAGESNSVVSIWLYDVGSRVTTQAETGEAGDFYIPRVKWTKDPNVLSIRKLNRLQNTLELIHANAATGKSKVVLTEKSDTFIDIEFTDDLTYLADRKHFIHSSEADGYKQLYLYSMDGVLVRKLPTGDSDIVDFLGLDEKAKILYYTSKEISPLETHLYSLSLDGRKKIRMSQERGTHDINMSRDFQFYIDHHSSASTPTVVTLFQTKANRPVKILEKNEGLAAQVREFNLAKKEFFSFNTSDRSLLNGFMLKPSDFSANREYPVVMYQYSGPGSQNVLDAWSGGHFYFHQMLVQHGYIVVVVDTRGTGGRGEKFKKVTYKRLGEFELDDILETAKYLSTLNFVDDTRMAVWGWSYGGYMSSLAMTKGAGVFKVGIAVAPVTSWRFYDTIYTERYLQTPQLNPEGYDVNSPSTHADKLRGKFLLVHGTADDNVHFQNSVVLQQALINAGKQFDSFYYPDKTHSISGGKTRLHLYTMMFDYIRTNL